MLHIVIGASRESRLPARVLEHTIRKHTTVPVTVHHTDHREDLPANHDLRRLTGFSCQRFIAPEIVREAGGSLGIYMDSDMLVFRDISLLANHAPKPPHTIARPTNQTALLVFRADQIKWTWKDVLEGWKTRKWTYSELLRSVKCEDASRVIVNIPEKWNSLDVKREDTCNLHFTDMSRQPWKTPRTHPFGSFWFDALFSAVRQDGALRAMIEEDVAQGHLCKVVQERLHASA